jgi:hypothetical protein
MIDKLCDPMYQKQQELKPEMIIQSIANLNKSFYIDNEQFFIHSKNDIRQFVDEYCFLHQEKKLH